MNNKAKRLYWLLRAELEMYYQFPWIELIFGLFLSLGVLVFFGSFRRIPLLINQDPDLHGPVNVDAYAEILRNAAASDFLAVFNMSTIILAFILPIILSNSLAGPIQNGFMQTLISYPVSRNQIIISKILVSSAITFFLLITGCSLPFILFTPYGTYPSEFFLIIVASILTIIAISTTSVFVSLFASSQMSATTITSGVWLSLIALAHLQSPDSVVRMMCNPVLLTTDYILSVNPDLLIEQVVFILGVYAIIGVLGIIGSLIVFNRKEL